MSDNLVRGDPVDLDGHKALWVVEVEVDWGNSCLGLYDKVHCFAHIYASLYVVSVATTRPFYRS